MEKPDVIICQWAVSLYDEKKRKWIYGLLTLRADEAEFSPTDDKIGRGAGVVIHFEDWIDIKKATTGLVFGAVYIVTKDSKKHWFSSLDDRDGFYGTLNHFWKAQLFHKKDKKGGSQSGTGRQTNLGQKLVGLVQDSQDTLSEAAVQLNSQGRQIDSSLWTMSDLHNDLDVAERFVKDIESWVGRWRLPKQYSTIDPVVVNKCDIPEMFEIEIVHSKLETGKSNPRVVGLLRMCRDGVYILSQRQALVHHFRWSDVSKIRVVTPYEIMIIQYFLGKPDLVYDVVCAEMMAILRLVDKCAKYKLEYDKPPDTVVCIGHQTRLQRQTGTTSKDKTFNALATPGTDNSDRIVPAHEFEEAPQLQVTRQEISDQEIDQITQGLTSLKSLALAVQEEESVQNEKLDSLRTTVDRANDRLTAINKRVNRML